MQTIEQGFLFLKDPQFLTDTLFLKSTKRIMPLTVVMTLRWFMLLVQPLESTATRRRNLS